MFHKITKHKQVNVTQVKSYSFFEKKDENDKTLYKVCFDMYKGETEFSEGFSSEENRDIFITEFENKCFEIEKLLRR